MFLFHRTIYALQIVFILSMSKMVLGKPNPYIPGIGISVMHPGQINGQQNWNEYDVSNKFGSPEDDINKDDNVELASVLNAFQNQWEQNWNEYDVSSKFGSPEDDINKDENVELARVLNALQNQWEQMVMENTWRNNLKLVRL